MRKVKALKTRAALLLNAVAQKAPQKFWYGLAFVAMTLLLYASFCNNAFKIADDKTFEKFHQGFDRHVVLRLIQNQRAGSMFEKRGMWWLGKHAERDRYFVVPAYYAKKQTPGGGNLRYISTFGIQGDFYSLIDGFFKTLSLAPIKRLKYMHSLTAFLTALTLAAFIFLIGRHFSFLGGLLSFLFVFLAPQLTLVAKSTYWVPFLWFLPMLWCWYYYIHHKPPETKRALTTFSLGFFVLVSVKMLAGYEYITSVLIGSGAILVYGLTREGFTKWRLAFQQGLLLVINSIFAFIITLAMTASSTSTGLGFFIKRAAGRTHGEPLSDLNWKWSTLDVLQYYLVKTKVLLFSGIRVYLILILLTFFILGLLYFIRTKVGKIDKLFWSSLNGQKLAALFLFAFLSFLASVSSYILFKNHVAAHLFMDQWHLPFLIILPALVCAMWQSARTIAESSKNGSFLSQQENYERKP